MTVVWIAGYATRLNAVIIEEIAELIFSGSGVEVAVGRWLRRGSLWPPPVEEPGERHRLRVPANVLLHGFGEHVEGLRPGPADLVVVLSAKQVEMA